MLIKKLFAFLGFIGVACGAFGSHYLKNRLDLNHQQIWTTATFYLFVHVLVGLYSTHFVAKRRCSILFLSGILFFSGSLYLLSILGIKQFGYLTPVGGILLLIGWMTLFFDMGAKKHTK